MKPDCWGMRATLKIRTMPIEAKSGRFLQVAPPKGNVLDILGMKILIAEDDRDSRQLLGWILAKLGYQVVAVENGKQAWEAYRHGRFRLVISDLLMPDLDGLELCRCIRASKHSKYIDY